MPKLRDRREMPAAPRDADGPRRDRADPRRSLTGGCRAAGRAGGRPRLDQNPEQRAAAFALRQRDRTAMGEDHLAGEAEADAGALGLGGEEGKEDVLPKGLRHAGAVIT